MDFNINTWVEVSLLILNLLTIIGFSTKHERRMTRIETFVEILVSRAGIHTRTTDKHSKAMGEQQG